jgi:preprotein translocase subunit SecD
LDGNNILDIKILERRFMDDIFISFELNDIGKIKLYEITKDNVGRYVYLYFDNTQIMSLLISMPINANKMVLQSQLNEQMIYFINVLIDNKIIDWDWKLLDNIH